MNDVLRRLTWDPALGALDLGGSRYMLVRPETVVVFQREVEAVLGAQADALMFAGGRSGGGGSARKLHTSGGLAAADVAAAMCQMGTQLGWGAFRVALLDRATGQMEIEVVNSAFAGAYGPSPAPVCHFIRGVFAGVAEIALGHLATADEVQCSASGGELCRFRYKADGLLGSS